MKLKELEGYLGSLQQFFHPKVDLEQYPTGPHIASRMLYMAENTFGDIMDKVVVDLGCGCGTLGLAAMLMGAEHVIGVDMDSDALEIASSNATDLETEMDFIKCDVGKLSWTGPMVDTVIMNPPFGTRKKGADLEFLSTALKVSAGAVYSLHKTSTREHVQRSAIQNLNAKTAEVLCQLRTKLTLFESGTPTSNAISIITTLSRNYYIIATENYKRADENNYVNTRDYFARKRQRSSESNSSYSRHSSTSSIASSARSEENFLELDRYLALPCDEKVNPLIWWQAHQQEFPKLSLMARDYLCIQATSVACKQLFSVAANTITKTRNRLDPETARATLCAKSWLEKVFVNTDN